MMDASEGKPGRVFFIRLDAGDEPVASIERFAAANGIHAGQVFALGRAPLAGFIAPDADGKPGVHLPDGGRDQWNGCEMIIWELLGFHVRRVHDPDSGREMVDRVASAKTRVMEKPAPVPDESGPGCVPVYLFNAEFS